jgi:galactokinase
MFSDARDARKDMPDVSTFIRTLRASREFFATDSDLFIARAPGRLDIMGGFADYSGSHVLEMPIAEAALAAVQKDNAPIIKIVSLGVEQGERTNEFEMPLSDLFRDDEPISYSAARKYFKRNRADSWAAYVAGAFLVLMREKGVSFDFGSRIMIDSRVPEGKGVSSSAAIEVAAMNAIAAAFNLEIEARELAILCQKVENVVVGAPCGIMDQMTAAIGETDRLLSMICQPAEPLETVTVPNEIAFWGIDSGIRHSVGAGDYGSVRTGAFMGYRIIAGLAGLKVNETSVNGVVAIDDRNWNGYLANITPDEFERDFSAHLPREMSGAEFLARYQGITDTVTSVQPDKNYAVFEPTKHPVYENYRVQSFTHLLGESYFEDLGQLMYASHQSYSDCGLGTSETDLIVELVRESPNLFGAKITGGGSGGTVAVLGRKDAKSEVEYAAAEFESLTGYKPYIFSGSSMGAAEFGHLRLSL